MTIHALGPFRLDTRDGVLLRGTEPVALGQRAIALLRALVERPGALVSKDSLIAAAWPGLTVEDGNLTVQIAALRRALGAAPGGDRWIETMPRRGYRFVGLVAASNEKGVTTPPSVDVSREAAPIAYGDAERRQITAMSCELIGAAGCAGGMDLEDLRKAVEDFRRCVSQTAGRRNGFLSLHLGNNALVLLGYPKAHEDDAEQAVRAGLELCAEVRTLRPHGEAPLRCRVGVATGQVIIGNPAEAGASRGREIVGDVLGVAARLLTSAPPDAEAIDPTTRRLIGDLFECHELGTIATDGGAEPIRCWQVLGESLVASRFEALRGAALSPLVGRDEEIDLLLRRWVHAKAGDGQIVLLSGEPGIGKSRLASALEERLQDEPYLRLRSFCSPHHQNSALFPSIGQLGRAAGFARDDPPAARLEKLEALLARAAPSDEDVALLADLLSLPASERHPLPNLTPQKKKERILEALIRQIEGLACRQPILMVFEDAHWIDPTTRELLDLIVERVRSLPALLIVTSRPEFQPPWAGQPRVTMLTLNRLDRRDQTALATQIASGKALPADVIDQIAEHTDGVPLFIEELTKSVLESGLLREEQNRYIRDRAMPSLTVPTSLNFSVMARLDRSPAARWVAQIGAAIGRQFSYALLHAVCRLPEDELQAALDRLVSSELVFRRGAPPDALYRFKHALVQDAAHGSLLRDTRRQLHAQIAEALETHSPELMENQPELLAQHYTEAGLVEKAVMYWGKAGHRSAARSAMAEAAAQLQKGLDQLALLPATPERQRRELEYCSALGAVLLAVKGHTAPETGNAFARARELWEQLDSPSEFLQVAYGQSQFHALRGELDRAQSLAEQLLRLSRERNDSAGLVLGYLSSGRCLMYLGRLVSSWSHLEAVLAIYDPISHDSLVHETGIHPEAAAQLFLGLVMFGLGYPDQALARVNAATAEARRLAHPPTLAGSLGVGAALHSIVGGDAALDERASELVAVATEQGFPHWHAQGTIYRGWAMVKHGDVAEGISLLRSGSAAHRAAGAEIMMPHSLTLLSRACEIAGQIEEAMSRLADALQIVERTGARWFAAELYRHKGQLLLRLGHVEAAEEHYRIALGIAREQEAKMWELRAATSLARLRRAQRRRAEARDVLEPIFGWFTEGFATPDLKEAKALLDALT